MLIYSLFRHVPLRYYKLKYFVFPVSNSCVSHSIDIYTAAIPNIKDQHTVSIHQIAGIMYLKHNWNHFIGFIWESIFPHCVKSIQIRSFLWSALSLIQTEYGEIWENLSIFCRNAGKYGPEKTPYLDTFQVFPQIILPRFSESFFKKLFLLDSDTYGKVYNSLPNILRPCFC